MRRSAPPDRPVQRSREIEVKNQLENCRHAGEPSWAPKVGDEVRITGAKDAFVSEVLAPGKVFLVSYMPDRDEKPAQRRERIVSWLSLSRPEGPRPTSFTKKGFDLEFYQSPISDIVNGLYSLGINDKPAYQRDYVWSLEDKQRLLESLFRGRDIGKFVLVERWDGAGEEDDIATEILDGKQRLSAIMDYMCGRYAFQGVLWPDLSSQDQYTIRHRVVPVARLNGNKLAERELIEIFLEVNAGGVPQSDEHLERVRGMLAGMKSSAKGSAPRRAP